SQTIIDGNQNGSVVTFVNGEDSTSVLTGFTITNGRAPAGGGINCLEYSSPYLSNLIIKGNNAYGDDGGGGIHCYHASSPTLCDLVIKENITEYGPSSGGGGISLRCNCSPNIINTCISNNTSNGSGGGIYIWHSSLASIINSTISNNTHNSIYGFGGGIFISWYCHPSILNTIISNNSGHGIYLQYESSTINITYSCFWNNPLNNCSYGEGCIQADPLFNDPANGDYHLTASSPCIDAGTAFFVWEGDTLVDMSPDEYFGSAPDMGAFEYNGETLVQYVNLSTGWNIFSTYFIPEDLDMLTVVQPLIDAGTLDKVLDESGNAILYFMGNWVNNIGDLANTEGYYIKVNDDVALTIEGTAVELPFEIDLTSGWNIMGYPTDVAQDGLNVVQPLINANELNKVLDETGNAILYFFGEWVNNIGDFEAGEGYYTKVNTNTFLTINQPSLARVETATVEDKTEKTSLSHFSPVFTGNPFMPMGVYLVSEEFANLDLETGDEVAVYDNDLCVGANVVEGEISIANPLIIITSMDDEIGMPGFSEGNPISYRVWDASENSELVVNDITNYDVTTGNELNSKPVFDGLGIIAVGFKSYLGGIDETTIPESFALHQNYPNPFNPVTTIRYHLPVKSDLRLKIYDLKGRLVETLVNKQQNPGFYSVEWKAENVSSGVYFYRLEATEFTETKKMVLLR
ncbi:MAG: T9SS type A sorting domain-containing protein, partial [Candidatus Marinimicrobia bacterium]|nr:T9SS type A sorting domain-containing protein [Candidatus Neomarinimicrobiota bacterium]